MADRIFPNRFQEDPLDSDLVFQGIDWDNFNQRLAEANEPKENNKKFKFKQLIIPTVLIGYGVNITIKFDRKKCLVNYFQSDSG